MRKGKRLILSLLVLMCGGAMSAWAQATPTVLQVHSLDENVAPKETALKEIAKMTFSTKAFDIHLTNDSVQNYTYADVKKITFKKGSSGIQNVVTNEFRVSPNPVESMLNITGYDATQEYQLAIYAMTGQEILRVADWKGESINVSGLAAGVYFININTTTIKFIKL